jgi:hypothetical protein
LIPARLDLTAEGRERLGVKEGEGESGRLTGFTQAPATFEEALAAIGGGGDLVGVGAETGPPSGADAVAAAAVYSSSAPKDDGGLQAAVTALTDAANAGAESSESSESGDDEAVRAAEALRASTSTAEESVEPAPQFVDDGDASEGDSSAE